MNQSNFPNGKTNIDSTLIKGTLENCIKYALDHQPILKQSLLDERITNQTIKSKLADWFPQLNFSFNIQHNYEGSTMNSLFHNYQCSFNPLEKVMELYEDRMALYERMLKDKEDMVQELRSLLHKN